MIAVTRVITEDEQLISSTIVEHISACGNVRWIRRVELWDFDDFLRISNNSMHATQQYTTNVGVTLKLFSGT